MNETAVTQQARKLASELVSHILGVVGLEIPIASMMKMNHQSHYLTPTQLAGSYPALTALEQPLMPNGFIFLPEIIDLTEQFELTHDGTRFTLRFVHLEA